MESVVRTGDTNQPAELGTFQSTAWDKTGFGAVYSEHVSAIYYLALRMLGNPDQAEDATHDIFLRAFRNYGEFRGESAVRTWLYRIAINHCRNLLKSWHSRTMVTESDPAFWERAATVPDTPFRILEMKELGQQIQRALDMLPEEYRLLLLLVADEKLSYEEVADLTGQTTDAVRGKLHRARKAFAAAFASTH